jgi:hypothetical protein
MAADGIPSRRTFLNSSAVMRLVVMAPRTLGSFRPDEVRHRLVAHDPREWAVPPPRQPASVGPEDVVVAVDG